MNHHHFCGSSSRSALDLCDYNNKEEDIFVEHFDIKIIDEVIQAFLLQYHMDTLLKLRDDNQFVAKTKLSYIYDKCTYTGTVQNKRSLLPGRSTFAERLRIRLSSDGFKYPPMNRADVLAFVVARNRRGWAVLSADYIKTHLSSIKSLAEELNCRVKVLYNARFHRFDISFKNHTTSNIDVFIALGAGNSNAIDKDEYYAAFGSKHEIN